MTTLRKFENFDQSSDDFEIAKKEVLLALEDLMLKYDDFTREVAPKHWRTTGVHYSALSGMKEAIEGFTPRHNH